MIRGAIAADICLRLVSGQPRKRSGPPSFVVVGTSAGGATALLRIFRDLPEGFPGAILIVMHIGEKSKNWLPDRLSRGARVPVKVAENSETIRQGTAYVAPAGTHMSIDKGRIELSEGLPEQHVRPSIDVLFRSAAQTYGPRVIGVILTGMLRDGTLGLRAVREAGGLTIVQNPEHAEEGDMPRNAMRDLNVDYCLELAEIGPVLDLLVRRAGSNKKGVLETGLASSLRFMAGRARLLTKLYDQSEKNPKTQRFLRAEMTALAHDISRIQGMIPSEVLRPRRAAKRARASRRT